MTDEFRARFEANFETLVQLVRFGWTLSDLRFRRVLVFALDTYGGRVNQVSEDATATAQRDSPTG